MKRLAVAGGVNLLLGVPGVVPCFLVWYVMANGPLAELGWTQREPTENDGMWLWLVILVPVLTLFGLVWGLLNTWMSRRMTAAGWPARPAPYWTLCAVAPLVPYLTLVPLSL
ncbi:integral membrane protein [Streptomyces laurentii]|uniref:Integral membrane protein n=1 Tax=Streptomyces laurentii TaxID=39478 RepID=A0A160NXD1_STRLU|nr:integral membrane protein [Streptomyces laurentii]